MEHEPIRCRVKFVLANISITSEYLLYCVFIGGFIFWNVEIFLYTKQETKMFFHFYINQENKGF